MNSNNVVFQCFKTSGKKRLKKGCYKVLFNGKDSLLLHPQQRLRSLTHWQALLIYRIKFLLNNYQKKLVRLEFTFYICTPQNTESSLRYW